MAKRTYSISDKKREELRRKRLKGDDDDNNELRWPGDVPRARPQQSSSLLRSFGGPVSFDIDSGTDKSDTALKDNNHLSSLFGRALDGKLNSIKPKQSYSIHGSREDFENTMNMKSGQRAARSHLLTPPTETQKQQGQRAKKFFPDQKEVAASLATHVTKPVWTRKKNNVVEKVVKPEEPKQPYIPKQYAAEKSSAPRRNCCGDRLSSKSKEAQQWGDNQSVSPFLRLPGELRNRIYGYALGGNTINIGYETYRSNMKNGKLSEISPVFKYHCVVYNRRVNPYKVNQQRDVEVTREFTMLNNVCRQLYLETSTLPFALNRIAFESYSIMFNFVIQEQRLSRQQRQALTHLLLRDDLPGANILAFFPNLEKVFLDKEKSMFTIPRGWYNVVRAEGQEPELRPVNRY